MGQIVILTAIGEHYGSGHFNRCCQIANDLSVSSQNFFVFTSDKKSKSLLKNDSFCQKINNYQDFINQIESRKLKPNLILIDKRESPYSFLIKLQKKQFFTIGIDVTKHQTLYRYIINPLPSLLKNGKANLNGLAYLPLIKNKISLKSQNQILFDIRSVNYWIIFLGHSDKTRIGVSILKNLKNYINTLKTTPEKIIFINGNGNSQKYAFEISKHQQRQSELLKIEIITIPQMVTNLFNTYLMNSKLVFCHFGITAFMALNYGIPVILNHPSKYHRKLSQKHLKYFNDNLIKKFDYTSLKEKALEWRKNNSIGSKYFILLKLLKSISNSPFYQQQLFLRQKNYILYRKETGNIVQNREGIIFLDELIPINTWRSINQKTKLYHDEYFLEEYQETYGKTYEEDREYLYQLADNRISTISKLLKKTNIEEKKIISLLDIGTATGYFLDRAQKNGFKTIGVEASSYASKIANKKHTIFCGNIEEFNSNEHYQVITMWYVIEHFKRLDEILSKISSWQLTNSILSLSTPNICGLVGKFDQRYFFKTSPLDHYYLFSPKILLKILKKYHYELMTLNYTGIHLNRFKKYFPKIYNFVNLFGKNKKTKQIYSWYAQKFGWGDTFEMYLIKK